MPELINLSKPTPLTITRNLIHRSLVILAILIAINANGQKIDSVVTINKNEALKFENTINNKTDSLQKPVKSLQKSIANKYDSITKLANFNCTLDSIKILTWAYTLKRNVNLTAIADSLNLNRRLDSLRTLGIKAKKITRYQEKQMAKIRSKQAALLREVNGKQQELQQQVTGNYNKWQTSLSQKMKLDSLGLKAPGVDLKKVNELNPAQKLNVPNGAMPGLPNASVPGVPNGSIPGMPAMPRLETSNFTNLNLSNDLKKVGGNFSIPSMNQLGQLDTTIPNLPQFKNLTGEAAKYKSMLKDPKAAESAVMKLSEVSPVSKELEQANGVMKNNEAMKLAGKMKSEEALKNEAKNMAQKEAINHFKGQEQALKGAMDQMAKYKKKYHSLNSLKDIKKNDWLPVNGLKGRPFRERFRIGLHTGFQSRRDTLILDFYPNVSYKFTGRIEAGFGAIYRIRTQTSTYAVSQDKSVWGLASFVIFKTFKSTYFRMEVDGNNHTRTITPENPSASDWRWTFLAGVQTNYKISNSFTGNIQMLYNFQYNLKDKFPEAMTLRFGVQYKLKRKTKN